MAALHTSQKGAWSGTNPSVDIDGCNHAIPASASSRKKNPPGLSRRVLSQLSRGMSYEIRDCSNGSRRRLTNIPAGKPAGVNQRAWLAQRYGRCRLLLPASWSGEFNPLFSPASASGAFFGTKKPPLVSPPRRLLRDNVHSDQEGHLGRVIAFR
jgi:hypothetical protein